VALAAAHHWKHNGTAHVVLDEAKWLPRQHARLDLRLVDHGHQGSPDSRRAIADQACHEDGRLNIRQSVMGVLVSKPVGGGQHVEFQRGTIIVVDGHRDGVGCQRCRCLGQAQHIRPLIAICVGQVDRLQGLKKRLPHQRLVEGEGVVPGEYRWRPLAQLLGNGQHRFVVGR